MLRFRPRAGSADREERLRMFRERVAAQDREHPGYADTWQRFADTLLAHGGLAVVPPLQPDPLLDLLSREGAVVDRDVVVVPGDRSACHRNAVRLWRSGEAVAIGTGYALSDDGLWREHSWAVDAGARLVETTEARVRYFGITMADDRAAWFADWVDGDSD